MADGTQIKITAVDQTTAAFRSVQSNISSLQGTLRGIAGPLAAAFSIAGIAAFSKSLIDAADRLAEISQKTGVAAGTLSALSNAAKMNGVDMEGLGSSMVRLNRAISEATSGSKEQIQAFAAIGIAQEELKKLSTEEVFYRIADAFAESEDGAGKTAVAMALLGKSGAELIPTLNMGRAELQKFSATFSTEFVNAANEFNDNIDRIIQSVKSLGADALTPVITELNKFILYLRSIARVAKEQGFWKTLLGMTEIGEWLGMGVSDKIVGETNKIIEAQKKAGNLTKPGKKIELPGVEGKETTNSLDLFRDKLKKIDEATKSIETPTTKYYQALRDLVEIQDMLFPDEYMRRLEQIENDYANSQKAIELNDTALKRYRETIRDVGMALDNMAVRALVNLEDSLLRVMMGTMTVKDAFRSMAISIIEDLIRIQIRKSIVGPLADALSAFFASGSPSSSAYMGGITPRARGGTAQAGQTYMVGEKGPELFIPGRTGSVVPNNQLGGSGAVVNQTINISTGVSQTVRAEIVNMLPRIMESTKAAIADSKRRGGGFAKMMGT
jgi:hypothetical protein